MIGYIYQIINNENQQRYIGKTVDVQRRKREHFENLKQNKYINKKLQNAWNIYGEDAFSFTYQKYEIENEDELSDLGINTIREYDSYTNGYNLTAGGDGGNTRGTLSFENYCIIYLGCQWKGLTEKIGKVFGIDSSTVSTILREKAYLPYKANADNLSLENKEYYKQLFKEKLGIPNDKIPDGNRVPTHLTEDDYFYCLCIVATHGRGVEAALGKYFDKHKSFLSNGIKGKTKGKAYMALQRFRLLPQEEVEKIGKIKFEEWNIQDYSSIKISFAYNGKWRN